MFVKKQMKRFASPTIFPLLTAFYFLLSVLPVYAAQTGIYNVTDFGAAADGKTLDTKAIQAAVDSCSQSGGGTVFLLAGTYLSGTIYLKDHVRLKLAQGSVLLGSTNVNDYPLNKCDFPSYSDAYVGRALIWGEGLHDIAITGKGIIDGQGASFRDNIPEQAKWKKLVSFYQDTTRYRPKAGYINRPYIIRLINCRDVLVEDVTLRHSAMWMQQYLNCDFVRIRNITVYNHGSKNNDMIDIDCSRDVVISGCYGDSDDDGITLKSTGGVPTENVTISDCIVSSFCNAIKMGTESSGGFKNITITNCVIRPSSEPNKIYGRAEGLAGLALEIVDGGWLDGITISNITIKGTTAPIFMRLGNRARRYKPDLPEPAVGKFRNVIISNITAKDAGATGCSITGLPDYPVENVTLANINISFVGGGTKEQAEVQVPENERNYPESTMFGILPAYGFFCRHVNGLTFRDIKLSTGEPDYRPSFICDDVSNLKLDGFAAQTEHDVAAQVVFRNVRNAMITGCAPTASAPFLSLENQCDRISVFANDFRRIPKPILFDKSTPKSALYEKMNRKH